MAAKQQEEGSSCLLKIFGGMQLLARYECGERILDQLLKYKQKMVRALLALSR